MIGAHYTGILFIADSRACGGVRLATESVSGQAWLKNETHGSDSAAVVMAQFKTCHSLDFTRLLCFVFLFVAAILLI